MLFTCYILILKGCLSESSKQHYYIPCTVYCTEQSFISAYFFEKMKFGIHGQPKW